MFVTCITHADARGKSQAFRGLTEQGWREVDSAAERFRELMEELRVSQDEAIPRVKAVVSSPKARCLETAVLLAKAISDFKLIDTSEVQVEASIKAGSITGHELAEIANSFRTPHLLVSAHADLAKALPDLLALNPTAVKDGWFTTRPVLFTIDYEVGEAWEEARVLYCEGYIDEAWQDLVRS